MDEYIKRKAALEECDWYANEFCECEYAIMPLKGALEILPAADVRPAFRGTWGHRWICSDMSGYEYACSCSVCGKPTYRMSLLEKMPNFCPNCGADMRGGKLMDKQAITIDELVESLNACVHGDDCEKCIECKNLRERFCWVNLMRKTAEVLEQLKQKEKFHAFLWNTIQPNEMEVYLSMYNAGDKKEES